MRTRTPNAAFTLLEIMLAIGIFSGLLIAMYASWSAVMRSAHLGTRSAIEAHRLRTGIHAVDEAFKSAAIFESNLHLYSFLSRTSEEGFTSFSLASHLSPDFPGSAMFHDQPIRRVAFAIEETREGNQLVLYQNSLVTGMSEEEVPYSLVLLENVQEFRLEYWDLGFDDWIDRWDATNRFPSMVRLSVDTAPIGTGSAPKPDRKPHVRVIHVPAATIRSSWQNPPARRRPSRP